MYFITFHTFRIRKSTVARLLLISATTAFAAHPVARILVFAVVLQNALVFALSSTRWFSKFRLCFAAFVCGLSYCQLLSPAFCGVCFASMLLLISICCFVCSLIELFVRWMLC